ncbi:hypothetical protein [Aquimarina pacifica]|uniref:hypothetical protein n=1 Tax=Aquimarina pacifica TaxID=1296415 RepID=UPI000471B256|nr:hypothetical protein [Aquimarina pacifica]
MNTRNWYIGLFIFSLFSCDSFVLKKENKDKIVKEELDKLNRNEVEQPPLFRACRRKQEAELVACFQSTITNHIQNTLAKNTFTLTESIHDTLWIPLRITKEGTIQLEEFELPDIIKTQIPELKNKLEESIQALPKVKPAHTRGTPVTTQYKLPLVIHID